MTEQEQRIALCEWAGWTDVAKHPTMDDYAATGISPSGVGTDLPDTNNLNVLHEIEVALKDTHGFSSNPMDHEPLRYLAELSKIVKAEVRQELVLSGIKKPDGTDLILSTMVYTHPKEELKLILATAAQRREALLKTLGLWK